MSGLYSWYRDHHVCVRCHNADAANGSIYCQPCRAKALKTQKEWDSKNPTRKEEYLKKAKAKRTEWAAAGLCSRCGREREDKRFKTCLLCRRGGENKMQSMILGCISLAICWVAWRRHNRLLDEQAEDSGVELQPVKPGFDYETARKQIERQDRNLKQYEQCSRLLDDSVVAVQSGEDMPLELTYFDHVGSKQRAAFTDVPPEIVNDFARQLLDVCTVRCSSPLQKNDQ